MANEEALGPRKTMFVLVIVVGCFAVLWPRILSPLLLGSTREQLKPNQFDRDAGCCDVMFGTELAVLEILNVVCSSSIKADGKLSPYAAAECRKTVNETCGVDIQAFVKRSDNVGKTSKKLLDTMKASNGSCLEEHFGVHMLSLSMHQAYNSWILPDTVKQERPMMRGAGPHPALRERGRAIPAGVPTVAPRPAPLPPHIRVRTSPLQGYFELEIKPPPIPGMRPPLGSAGGPVQAPKSSMGFVMPIYTICIIVFFVYTLSKILFKRTGAPYEPVTPDVQFRKRVFRDNSRSSPDKLGPVERDTIVTAISGLVAEVKEQMEASYAQNQQRQEPDSSARPYTNGTLIHSGPVQIVASEYRELSPAKEQTPELKEPTPEIKEPTPESEESAPESKEPTPEAKEPTPVQKESSPEAIEDLELSEPEESLEKEFEALLKDQADEKVKWTDNLEKKGDSIAKLTGDFLDEERDKLSSEEKESTPELLKEALKEEKEDDEEEEEEEEEVEEEEIEEVEPENASVKVVGMETTAHAADGGAWPRAPPAAAAARVTHEAEQVKSIYLETEIPQQSRVLVADFGEKTADKMPAKGAQSVVSGKMTLSLIQDAPRDTPDRDPESTLDDFTTASAMTQPADNKQKEEDLSDDEEVEIEEIEEEVEEESEEEEPPVRSVRK